MKTIKYETHPLRPVCTRHLLVIISECGGFTVIFSVARVLQCSTWEGALRSTNFLEIAARPYFYF